MSERFWSRVDKQDDGCWVWNAHIEPNGYGKFTLDGVTKWAHRMAYEMIVGEIPEGLVIDHLCRNRACVNPNHLEAVTQQENSRRGDTGKYQSDRTHCPKGHAYEGENLTTWTKDSGSVNRKCRACHREANRRYRQRQKAAA